MKTKFNNYFKNTIRGGVLTCIVLLLVTILFTSCENFLNAGKVSEDIKNAIDYNNAKSVTVSISCEKEMGSVFPSPSYQAKVGYAFEIQFIPNLQNYEIIDPETIFEAVSRINETESRSEFVEFSVVEQSFEDKKNGLYRVSTKIIKPADDILLKPACNILPRVVSVSPEFATKGVAINNPITVVFTTPMNIQSIKDNILITTKDNSNKDITMNGYFETPVFNEEENGFTLEPRIQEIVSLMDLPSFNSSYIDIQITLNEEIKSQTGTSLIQDSNSTFKVRYTPDIEDTKPVMKALFASRTQPSQNAPENHPANEIFFNDLEETKGALSDTEYREKVLRNRIKDKVYIYGRYEDIDSGVKKISIAECRTRDTDGRILPDPKDNITEYVVGNEYENSWFSIQEGMTSFCIEYNLKSDAGFVHLKTTVFDACGNASLLQDIPAIVVNASCFNQFWIYNYTDWAYDYLWDAVDDDFDETDYSTESKKLKVGYNNSAYGFFNDVEQKIYYGEYPFIVYGYNDLKPYSYCEYIHSDNQRRKDPFTIAYGKFEAVLDVASLNGLEVRIVIADDIGNYVEKTIQFPNIPDNVYYSNDGTKLKSFSSTPGVAYYYIETKGETITLRDNSTTFAANASYRIWPTYFKDISGSDIARVTLFGDIGTQPYTQGTAQQTTVSAVTLSDEPYSIRNDGIEEKLTVALNLADGERSKYDRIYVSYYDDSDNVSYKKYFTNNSQSIEFICPCSHMFSNGISFEITGIKGNIFSEPKTVTIPALSTLSAAKKKEYDSIPPKATLTRTSIDSYSFTITDGESGPKAAYLIKKDGSKQLVTGGASGFSNITIPAKTIEKEALLQNYKPSIYESAYTGAVFELTDEAKNTIQKVLVIWPAGNIVTPVQDFRKKTGESNKYYVYYPSYLSSDSNKLGISTLTSTSTTWSSLSEDSTIPNFEDGDSPWYEYPYTHYKYEFSITDGRWVKLHIKNSICYGRDGMAYLYNYSIPKYYYAGNPSSGDYDYVLDYGTNSKLIASDAPVFVHTVVTDKSFDECSDWTVEEWESSGESKNIKYIPFATNNTNQRKYTIPDDIERNSCYVVIVHFAGSKTEPYISEVMTK